MYTRVVFWNITVLLSRAGKLKNFDIIICSLLGSIINCFSICLNTFMQCCLLFLAMIVDSLLNTIHIPVLYVKFTYGETAPLFLSWPFFNSLSLWRRMTLFLSWPFFNSLSELPLAFQHLCNTFWFWWLNEKYDFDIFSYHLCVWLWFVNDQYV